MQRIKKGDEVVVISGRDKGKRGTVLRRVDAEHLVIEGVNRVKKHQRPNPMKGVTGGIVDKDLPIHISNIALFNPATKKADRGRHQAARRRPQGARVQGERRAGGPVNHGQGRKAQAGAEARAGTETGAAGVEKAGGAEERGRAEKRNRTEVRHAAVCRRRPRPGDLPTARKWCRS